jgi:hypothetical protein
MRRIKKSTYVEDDHANLQQYHSIFLEGQESHKNPLTLPPLQAEI